MDGKPYEAPEVYALGTVQELTKQIEKCPGSADLVSFRPPPDGTVDFTCIIDD